MSVCVCMSVCLSVRISSEPHAQSLPFFVHIAYVRGSVIQHFDDKPHRVSAGSGDGSAQRGRTVIYDCLVLCLSTAVTCKNVCRVVLLRVAEMCWRQWNSAPQRKGRPFGDVSASTTATPENGCRRPSQTPPRRCGGRADEQQQQLAEREAELRALRSTMERNEAAILRAMDDQRRAWDAEAAAERESWERRVRDAERRADDVRATLTDRIRDLERQNAALQSEHGSRGHGNVRARRAANADEHPGTGGERHRQSAARRRRR